ncbi:hypothetical protein J2W27_004000 [Variovorax boronicumulans]|uniref:hypothetical protein n=1 Tax=Variovorax boronicumulans TaxID=436515 RepID=UPI002783F050|nr:hypothetical protein [Variovorax boronicumulans]MDP9911876.1 hypothetical protein [Variovorax boronicumulans]
MTSITAYEAVQRALRDWPFASPPSLPSGCSVACSHGLPIAAAQSDVARQRHVITLKREGSLVAQAIETPYSVAQPEGQEPGPQDAPALDGACLLQCLYLADRCDRRCEGCAATTSDASVARQGLPDADAAAPGIHTPPSNTGVNNEVDEVGYGG